MDWKQHAQELSTCWPEATVIQIEFVDAPLTQLLHWNPDNGPARRQRDGCEEQLSWHLSFIRCDASAQSWKS